VAWLTFLLSAAVVVTAGVRLARDGDRIAQSTGLGGMWVGAILLAAATSLPELTTDISAVRLGAPDLAVGDLFGSNMTNILILALADLSVRQTRVMMRVTINQAAVGVIAIALTAVATLGVLVGGGSVLGLGWASVVIAVGYVAGMYLLHGNRPEPPFDESANVTRLRWRDARLRPALLGFGSAAIIILVAAPHLASSAADLATQLGISQGLAGMLLLAVATSMPEAAATIASVRTRAYDLAVGNLLGSNSFNMFILLPLDWVQGPGSLLAAASHELTIAGLVSIVMMSLAVIDVLDRAERRRWPIELRPLLIVVAYGVGLYLTQLVDR
jgi:cation:H+ antiporter